MPALIVLGALALAGTAVAVAACALSSRISRQEEERGPGWIVKPGDGADVLERYRRTEGL